MCISLCLKKRGVYEKKGEADMNKKTRIEKAGEKALERLDYILEHYSTPDFVEIVGRIGGDTVTYRVYNNGDIYER